MNRRGSLLYNFGRKSEENPMSAAALAGFAMIAAFYKQL